MNIFDIMEEEHAKIIEIIDQLERIPGNASGQRFEMFGQLREELQSHMRTEEDVLYSILCQEPTVKGSIGDFEQEHHAVDLLLDELDNIPMASRQWETKFRVLKEIIEEHFRNEEEVVYAEAERMFADRSTARISDISGSSRESAHLFAD